MWTRQELKEDSKALLKLNYWPFVLVAFIHGLVAGGSGYSSGSSAWRSAENLTDTRTYSNSLYPGYNRGMYFPGITAAVLSIVLIVMLIAFIVGAVLNIFLLNPIQVGCKRYMTMAREVKPQFGEMVFAFKNCYGNIVKTMFLKNLYIFLWSLLFVIPGIIKGYEYYMVPYLIAEYPDMESSEAFRISKEMMMGNKWNTFVLELSFIGWELLGIITLGLVNLFYVRPYRLLTDAALYLRLKGQSPAFSYVGPDNSFFNEEQKY